MYLGAKASARQGKHGWVGWFGDPNERVRADTQSGRKAGWGWKEGSRRKRKEAAGTGESPMGFGRRYEYRVIRCEWVRVGAL